MDNLDKNTSVEDITLDPLCKAVLRYCLQQQQGRISISMVQRTFQIGFVRSGKIVDSLEALNYVEPINADSCKLHVVVKLEDLDNLFPDMEG
ncbi:MAG: DNA translocase FtsK [Candidatus Fimimonas sp.]